MFTLISEQRCRNKDSTNSRAHRDPTPPQEVVEETPRTPGRAIPEEVVVEEEVDEFHVGFSTFEQERDYLGPDFDLRRDFKVAGGDTSTFEPWMACEHRHGVLLVRANFTVHLHLGRMLASSSPDSTWRAFNAWRTTSP